ncbi:MAG: DPP IV N-terminal domain-containing protein [Gemmatimonadota bacterium]|nr:DPP IV N-terminal domain-containing protein [Gemmatimonadota bacterium]
MRQNSRHSRHETTVASQLSARALSRAVLAIAAIGALGACSADQNLSSAPQQKTSSSSDAPAPTMVYVSDSSGVQQLWKVAAGVTSRLTFSNSVDKDPHSAAGHLVFASYRDGDEEIYMANNDLSGLKRLTTSSKEDEQPNLSRDGSRVAFVSYRSGTPRLWLMDSTGANQTAIETGSESFVPEMAPAWSPDGTKLVYTSTRSGLSQVFVISATGGTPVQLSNEMNGAYNPVWSADGSQIYFVSVVSAPALRVVTVATGETSDWVYDGNGIGQAACAATGCVAVDGAYGSDGNIVAIGADQSITTIVGTSANETSPTILVP